MKRQTTKYYNREGVQHTYSVIVTRFCNDIQLNIIPLIKYKQFNEHADAASLLLFLEFESGPLQLSSFVVMQFQNIIKHGVLLIQVGNTGILMFKHYYNI